MGIYIGSKEIQTVSKGNTEVESIMLGDKEVWTAIKPDITVFNSNVYWNTGAYVWTETSKSVLSEYCSVKAPKLDWANTSHPPLTLSWNDVMVTMTELAKTDYKYALVTIKGISVCGYGNSSASFAGTYLVYGGGSLVQNTITVKLPITNSFNLYRTATSNSSYNGFYSRIGGAIYKITLTNEE